MGPTLSAGSPRRVPPAPADGGHPPEPPGDLSLRPVPGGDADASETARLAAGTGTRTLYRDATWLATSSALTAGLGMAFWAVAARYMPPSRLGVETAVLSLVTAMATVLGSGAGDALTSLLPRYPGAAVALVRRAQRLVVVSSLVLGLIGATVAGLVLPQLRNVAVTCVLIVVAVPVWARFMQQDYALTTFGRARWLPVENGLSSVTKIAMLPALVLLGSPHPIIVATVVPALVAVVLLTPRVIGLARRADEQRPAAPQAQPDDVTARERDTRLRRVTLRAASASAMTLGSLTLLPFAVTALAGPTEGALFALCLSLVQALDFLGGALGVSLAVHAARHPEHSALLARQAFWRLLAIVSVGGTLLVLLSPLALSLLGSAYAGLPCVPIVATLACGTLVRTPFLIWAALRRSRAELRPLLVVNACAATIVYAAVLPLAPRSGALGAAVALLIAQSALAVGAVGHEAYRRGWIRVPTRPKALER